MSTQEEARSERVSLDDLFPVLERSGLLNPRELEEIRKKVAEGEYEAEPHALASQLVKDKWLTDFQARRCLLNRPEGLVLGRYLILDRIGNGGMGRVYKAKHQMMGRVVALKIIPTRFTGSTTKVARFRREMQIVGRLDHPHVVRAFDADQVGDLLYIAMEYVDGRSLEDVLRERKRLSVVEAVFYVMQAASALEHAHAQGVIHRDVKPSNLLLIGTKTVKLLDLGLGAFVENDEYDDFKTEAGITLGTMAYLSPEQACSKPVDGRSDIYSLGCVFFHLLAGRLPFSGDSSMERMAVRISGQITPISELLPNIHPRVAQVLGKMLAHSPDDRYQSAGEVASALKALIRIKDAPAAALVSAPAPLPTGAPTPVVEATEIVAPALTPAVPGVAEVSAASSPGKRTRRRRLIAGTVAALALFGGAFGLFQSGLLNSGPGRPGAAVGTAAVVASKPEPSAATTVADDRVAEVTVRGHDEARLGHWKESAAAFGEALRLTPGDLALWHRRSVALLSEGDIDGYRAVMDSALAENRDVANGGMVDLIRASCLAPDVLADSQWRIDQMEKASSDAPKRGWRLYVLGLAHYRGGHFRQAIKTYEEALKAEPDSSGAMLIWPALSLAHFRMGNVTEGEKWLGRARAWRTDPSLSKSRDGKPSPPLPWWERGEFDLILHEAEAIEAGEAPYPSSKPPEKKAVAKAEPRNGG